MKPRVEKEYNILKNKMDARDEFYALLQTYFNKYGKIPRKFIADWNKYQEDTRRWYKIPGLKRKIYKAAKVAAKNKKAGK